MNSKWPFVIIRCFGTGKSNHNFINCLFDAQKRHPGLVDEIWFAGNSQDGVARTEAMARESLPYRATCDELGIQFSYQQGITLNHNGDGKDHADFTDSDWAVDEDGNLYKGLLCPRSKNAYEYNRKTAEAVMSILKPNSYWPDDDDRVSCKPGGNHMICFCDRCLAAFNAEYHHTFTRAGLKDALNGTDPVQIRKEWTEFNSKSLAIFSAAFREAADNVLPDCRLGLQTVFPYSIYDGPDYKPMLAAMSGKEQKKVGIRPGAGYYLDRTPRDMFIKSLGMVKEGARCRKYGFIGQNCAEVENWPHIGAEKNPGGQMAESSLYLASGVDSLALYWGADVNRETDENYRFYFDTLAAWKPFLTAVRDSFAGSEVSGIATFHGSDQLINGYWENQNCDVRLLENAVPVTKMDAVPEVYALPQFAVAELAESDLAAVFAKPVLMDISAFMELAKKFTNLKFTKKISLQSIQQLDPATSQQKICEVFDGDKQARDYFSHVIMPQSADVRMCSGVYGMNGVCGTCVIPTEFGGSVVLMQNLEAHHLWTGYRRKTVLDALDSLLPDGGMSVRLLTGGFSICVIGRKNADGKTVGAYLLNAGIGKTMPLELAIRNPAHREYRLLRPECEPVKLQIVRQSDTEIVVAIPPLYGWQPALIAGLD